MRNRPWRAGDAVDILPRLRVPESHGSVAVRPPRAVCTIAEFLAALARWGGKC
jgi:hypothetical protein